MAKGTETSANIPDDIKNMKLLWEKTFKPEEVSVSRDFHQILVDKGGNMHVIFDKNNRKIKQEEHHFQIYESLDGLFQDKFLQEKRGDNHK